MDLIRFRIRHPAGRVDELVTESVRILIGTGSHCEIRLPVGTARVEHVFIEATPVGWRAIARSFDPAPTLDGAPFTEAPILGECVIAIGPTRIDVAPTGAPQHGEGRPRVGGRSHRRIQAYLALGLVGWIALYFGRGHALESSAEPREVPSPWRSSTESCPALDPEQALATASARLALAVAKEERSPFHPEDGVTAVTLYGIADACFRAAGHNDEAADVAASAARLRREVSDQVRVGRLRLRHALASEEWAVAEHESGVLLALLSSRGGEYVAWLSNLRRKLQVKYGSRRTAS
jgi:hypothetical protein